MKKVDVEIDSFSFVSLEYDDKEYEIEYVPEGKVSSLNKNKLFILRRKGGNKIIKVFTGNISFIVQCRDQDNNHFLVGSSSNTMMGIKGNITHYIDNLDDELIRITDLSCNDVSLNNVRMKDNVFLIYEKGYSGYLYNLKESSKRYSRVYDDEVVKSIMGDNILLVSEERNSRYDKDLKDEITYGIDIDTFDIKTPIYSKLQQRYIDSNGDGENTINSEIQAVLDIIPSYFEKDSSVYFSSSNSVNREFVKKFLNNL